MTEEESLARQIALNHAVSLAEHNVIVAEAVVESAEVMFAFLTGEPSPKPN